MSFEFSGFGYFLGMFFLSAFVAKNAGFSVLVFIAACGFSVSWHLVFGFSLRYRIWYPMGSVVFPIWVLVLLRSQRLH